MCDRRSFNVKKAAHVMEDAKRNAEKAQAAFFLAKAQKDLAKAQLAHIKALENVQEQARRVEYVQDRIHAQERILQGFVVVEDDQTLNPPASLACCGHP